MSWATGALRVLALAGLAALVLWPAQASAQRLTQADVERVIAAAAAEANARQKPATIAVVDRVGNVLGVFQMNGAPPSIRVTTKRGIPVGNGLERIEVTLRGFVAESPSSELSAIAKAVTGAYLSSGGNAFTTRTASQIIQDHFNPGETDSPSGPLFGVQFTQLPCSDLSVRFFTDAANFVGEVSATVGPKRSPLGLSADPGGLPLYKNGNVVGGIGVESDGIYTIDNNVGDFDADPDEIIAIAGASLFPHPIDIQANRIFVEGKSLRFTDVNTTSLLTNPATATALPGNGALVMVRGYSDGAIIAGQRYGDVASGFARETTSLYGATGRTVFVLYDDAGNPRFPPIDSLFPTTANGGITANEVTTMIVNALKIAFTARAQIRRPLDSHVQVTVSVVDADGNILGIARTPDGPIFGTDTSLQKARTAAFFSSPTAADYLGTYTSPFGSSGGQNVNDVVISSFLTNVQNFIAPDALANGIAFADRSGGNLSRPFYPDGIDARPNGPFSRPIQVWSPFNTGLQLDTVIDNIAQHILFVDGFAIVDTDARCTFFETTALSGNMITRLANGFQIFPGSVPIYRNGVVIGGLGVSGDGIDQDDMVSFLGLNDAGLALGTGIGNAPPGLRADNLKPQGVRLRYVNCPYKPFLASDVQNVCHGK